MVWLRMIAMSCLLGGCFQVVAEYTAPGSIVSRPGQRAPTTDERRLDETGLPPSREYGVGFSISNGEFAIRFFSLACLSDYYMENNTTARFGDGEMRFLPLFFDTSAGVFILVGSGEPALAKLRLL